MPDDLLPLRPSGGPRLVLIGPPGSGKSTVAAAAAQRWGLAVADSDAEVEAAAGKPTSEIFVVDGEPAFRELERAAVTEALRTHDGVLAVGGGAVLDPVIEAALADYTASGGVVVFLDVTLTHAVRRVGMNASRPLLLGNPRAQLNALLVARRPVYERIATVRVLTDDVSPDEILALIEEALGAAPASDGANRSDAAKEQS